MCLLRVESKVVCGYAVKEGLFNSIVEQSLLVFIDF